ncbi:MAG: hypothetical protein ACI8X5_000738 [Planctomycetota bacterium]|jgi:hypothetical protein
MKNLTQRSTLVVSGLLALFALSTPAYSTSLLGGDDDEDKKEDEEEAEPIPEEDKDSYFLVENADVHTGTGEVLRSAGVLSKNGKIIQIGYDLEVPGRDYYLDMPEEDRDFRVKVVDANGMRVYPGLVVISSTGLTGPSGDFRNSIDPFSQNMVLGLAAGITTTGAGRAAVKLKRYVSHEPSLPYDFDGIVLSESTYTSLTYSSGSSKRSLREKFDSARDYLLRLRQWNEDVKKDKDIKEPEKKGVDSTALAVLSGETQSRFRADDRGTILGIARFCQEYGFRPVIDGCREGWTVAEELGRAGAMAIITARDRRDKQESLVRDGGSSIENAAILSKAGVSVAIVPSSKGVALDGIVGRDIMHLPVEVGFAIRGGLSEELALASITTIPARMMGISHRVGTLEVGKDCDLIVTDGDLLHYQTFVQYAVVDGDLVYDKEEELFFAHIRPRPEVEVAPEATLDAGENEEVEETEGAEEEEGDAESEGEDKDS